MLIGIDSRSLEVPKTGVGRYLSNLLKYWRSNKKHKFILYFKDEIPKIDLIKSDNFEAKIIYNPFGFSSNFFFQHFLLPYRIKKDKADFFFSPFYLKPFYCPTRSSVTLHDVSYEAHPEWYDFKSQVILRILSGYSAKTADKIFTVSNYSKEEIIKYYKINPEKITVAYLAADDSRAIPKLSFRASREKSVCEKVVETADPSALLGMTKTVEPHSRILRSEFHSHEAETMELSAIKQKYNINGKFILCVGSIFNRRHIPEIIEAFKRLALKYGGYQLLIIGKNHTYPFIDIDEKIKTANERLGGKAIIRLDYASDEELAAFYNSCFLNIYLSDYEGFGLPVVEAQSLDKPVITSFNSSLAEIGGDSVEFVSANTSSEIFRSLEGLILDTGRRNELIDLGRENVKRFGWEKCARETLGKMELLNC